MLGLATTAVAEAFDARGAQFLGFTNFSRWSKSPGTSRGEVVLLSPQITTRLDGNELVAFSLTLTLSRWEREPVLAVSSFAEGCGSKPAPSRSRRRRRLLPLPAGEGGGARRLQMGSAAYVSNRLYLLRNGVLK